MLESNTFIFIFTNVQYNVYFKIDKENQMENSMYFHFVSELYLKPSRGDSKNYKIYIVHVKLKFKSISRSTPRDYSNFKIEK